MERKRERAKMKPHLNIGSVLLFTADLTNYVSLRVRMVKRGNRGMLWRGRKSRKRLTAFTLSVLRV